MGGQAVDGHEARQQHAAGDDHHLRAVGPGHGLGAAHHRVGHDEHPDEEDVRGDAPAQQHREHQGRGEDGDAHGQAALDQEEAGGKQPGLQVEAGLEDLIGRGHLQPVVERDGPDGQHDGGQGQAEVELHEAHAVHVGLARRGQERDGAGLGGDDREADEPPAVVPAAADVVVAGGGAAALVEAPQHHEEQGPAEDEPVQAAHAQTRASSQKPRMQSNSSPTTTA